MPVPKYVPRHVTGLAFAKRISPACKKHEYFFDERSDEPCLRKELYSNNKLSPRPKVRDQCPPANQVSSQARAVHENIFNKQTLWGAGTARVVFAPRFYIRHLIWNCAIFEIFCAMTTDAQRTF